MAFKLVRDSEGDWLKQSFLNSYRNTDENTFSFVRNRMRYFRHVDWKYTDATPGGNFAINSPPQHTRYADIRRSGRLTSNANGYASAHTASSSYAIQTPKFDYGLGMGREYSEKLDDNLILLHMCFGHPKYNSLSSFFTGFFNNDASSLARRGRGNGAMFQVGKVLGLITAAPLAPLLLTFNILDFLAQKPTSKFSYLKESMPLYWNAFNTIINSIAVNKGIIPRVFGEVDFATYRNSGNSDKVLGSDEKDTQDLMKRYNAMFATMFPGLFYKNGGIDIYSYANRAARIAEKQNKEIYNRLMQAGDSGDADPVSIIQEYFEGGGRYVANEHPEGSEDGAPALAHILQKYLDSESGTDSGDYYDEDVALPYGRAEVERDENGNVIDEKRGVGDKILEHLRAEARDGSRFITFAVENFGSVSESVSNQTTETDLGTRFNSMSSSNRMTSISFAQGNIGEGGIVGLVQKTLGVAKDVVTGIAEGLQVSGLFALMGRGLVDIPKTWSGSTVNLPTMSYTMKLRTPYANKLGQFLHLDIPMAALLAGALPLSTGTHSYTSPFCCAAFVKGAAQTRYGIIDSLTITRGTGNVGWTQEGLCTSIDISFSIVDLSTIMHMPIVANSPTNISSGLFDGDSVFNDYMAVLGGLGVNDQMQPFRRLGLAMTRKLVSYRKWASPARLAMYGIHSTIPGQIWNAVAVAQERP